MTAHHLLKLEECKCFATTDAANILKQFYKAEYDMKNYADRERCHPPKPKAEEDFTPSEIFTILHIIRKPNSIIVPNISRALKETKCTLLSFAVHVNK